MGVKQVVFLELWLGIASLELWLGMADEHEEPLSCGSGWRVDDTDYVRIRELYLALRCMIRSMFFLHVLYRLWPIGMAASHLEVIIRRCRTRIN